MSNFSSVLAANETAMNSAGSAARENSAYMESLEAKTNAVAESFQRLANSIVDNDLVALILDIAKSLLDAANTPIGKFILITTAVTAATIAFKGLWSALKIGPAILSLFTTSVASAAGALTVFNPVLAIIIGALGLLLTFAPQIMDFFDGLINPVEHFTEKIEDANEQLKTNKERLEDISKIPWYERTAEINAEAEELKKLNDELERNNEEYRKKAALGAQANLDKTGTYGTKEAVSYQYYNPDTDYQVSALENEARILELVEEATGKIYKTAQEAINAGEDISVKYEEVARSATEYYTDIIADQKLLNEKAASNIGLTQEETERWQKNNEELVAYSTNAQLVIKYGHEVGVTLTDEQYLIKKSAEASNEEFIKTNELLVEQDRVARITSNGFKITKKAADSFIKSNEDLAVSIAKLNGDFYIERQALFDLAGAGNTVAQQMVKDQKALTEATIENVKARVKAFKAEMGIYGTMSTEQFDKLTPIQQAQYRGMQRTIDENKKLVGEFESQIDSWVVPPGTGTGKGKKTGILESLKAALKVSEHEIFLMTKQDALGNADAIVAIYKQMQQTVHDKAEELRAKGYSNESSEVMELQKLWWGYSDEIKKVYQSVEDAAKKAAEEQEQALKESLKKIADYYQNLADGAEKAMDAAQKQADAYQVYAQMMSDYLQEQIEGYQAQIDAIDKANEEREKEIALQEKLNNLAKAQQKQVMVFKDGKFQYVKDTEAVSEAASDLAEFQRQQALEKEKQDWQDKIDITNEYKKEWDDFTKDYDKQANMQLLIQSNLFTQEDLIFKNRLGSAQNFATQYAAIMAQVVTAQKAMEAAQAQANKYANGAPSSTTDWSAMWWDVEKDTSLSQADRENIQKYLHEQKVAEMAGSGKKYNPTTGKWYANGTTSVKQDEIAMVGDKPNSEMVIGPKLNGIPMSLDKDTGIIPHNITENLMALGRFSPMDLIRRFSSTGSASNVYQYSFDKLVLPNISDANSFINALKNFKPMAIQAGSKR